VTRGEIRASVTLENSGDREDAYRGHGVEADVRRTTVEGVVDTGAVNPKSGRRRRTWKSEHILQVSAAWKGTTAGRTHSGCSGGDTDGPSIAPRSCPRRAGSR